MNMNFDSFLPTASLRLKKTVYFIKGVYDFILSFLFQKKKRWMVREGRKAMVLVRSRLLLTKILK